MSIDATNWAWGLQDITPTEKLVLLALADRAGETHEAWPSWSRLILDTGITRKTLNKVLNSIQKKGYIIKTGEKKRQVYVYRLMGVVDRADKLSTTSSKMTTSTTTTTSGKMTTSGSGKMTTSTSGKMTTQNHQLNPKRNPKDDSIFLSIQNRIENLALDRDISLTEDLTSQIEFYVDQSIKKQDAEQSILVSLSLIKKKQWKIPSGYKGITSQSIAKKEEQHTIAKNVQHIEDAKIMRGIRTKIVNDSLCQLKRDLK